MQRAILLLTATAAVLVLASGLALAATIDCAVVGNPCLGTPDPDEMTGTDRSDDMQGLGGDDFMQGLKANDTLNGGAGFDSLRGDRGEDALNGGPDKDTLFGGRNRDDLNGEAGDDDYLFANGWGKDEVSDTTSGMFGERLSFSMVTQPVTMDLIRSASRPEAKSGRNTLNFGAAILIVEVDGGTSGDTIRGQDDDDSLNGLDGADTIDGRGGGDSLMGAAGNDELVGGSGGDSFDAAEGADRIEAADNEADQIDCGAGNDTVFFDEGLDTFVDVTACENRRAA
jgi:Ca2+-binding RTX toxin-like protein